MALLTPAQQALTASCGATAVLHWMLTFKDLHDQKVVYTQLMLSAAGGGAGHTCGDGQGHCSQRPLREGSRAGRAQPLIHSCPRSGKDVPPANKPPCTPDNAPAGVTETHDSQSICHGGPKMQQDDSPQSMTKHNCASESRL